MYRISCHLIFITLFFQNICNSQINYGSNNGKYLTIRGTKIYYEEYGNGAPLLLLHGGFGDISDFKNNILELSKKFKLIIPDAPGLGRSEHADSIMSYQLMATYYSKMIDLLKLDTLNVIGWSDGGITALLLAKDRPDKIKKVITVGPNYRADGMKKEEIDFTQNKLCNLEWVETNLKDWVTHYKALSPQGDWKRYITEAKRMWFEEEYFPKSTFNLINQNVLLVFGDNDMYTIEHGLEMYRALKNGQFCVLPNTTHEVFREKPKLIDQIVVDFLKPNK